MTGIVSIPDLRDYERINAELVQCLDDGCDRVRLVGAEGQRFLAAGLAGRWEAVIEVEGRAGPELAAGLDAEGVTVVCRGAAGDGAGRSLRAGRLVILGVAADALAYAQGGGTILAAGGAGHRAGLNQRGGRLLILGALGRLAGERQSGGQLFGFEDRFGLHAGVGRRGGRLVRLPAGDGGLAGVEPSDAASFREALREASPWIPDGLGGSALIN